MDHCDVIGIDQRGTGNSLPNLSTGPDFAWELPANRVLTRANVVAAQKEAMTQAAAYWKEEGVDLAAYNTAESADDLEDVRRAIGLDKVALWGTSYGSHLGLAYLRQHPESIDRAVLTKVEGPDHTFKLPSQVQAKLEGVHAKLQEDAAAQEIPDLLGLVRDLLTELAEEPAVAVVDVDGKETEILCGAYDLQRAIADHLADTRGHVFLPAFVNRVAHGDYRELGQRALQHRRGDMWSGMAMMMDCSSGMSDKRARIYEREREDPKNLLSDALVAPLYPATCEGCGSPDLGEPFRAPFDCDVPILFVSGTLDARELISEDYRELLTAFLYGDELEDTTIALRWDRFAPVQVE